MSTIATLSPLSTPEQRKLAQYEETIETGMRSFVDVGTALAAIRDAQLYRSTDATFEDYCRRRWQFSASRARQLIGSVEAIRNVESVTTVTPNNEWQARVLAGIDTPQHQADVWAKAVATANKDKDGNPKITAAHVRKVADEMFIADDPPEEDVPAEDDQPKPYFDALNQPVPEHANQVWIDEDFFFKCEGALSALKNEVNSLAESAAGKFVPRKEILASLRTIKQQLDQSKPFSICPYCEGRKCSVCRETGIVTERIHSESKERGS